VHFTQRAKSSGALHLPQLMWQFIDDFCPKSEHRISRSFAMRNKHLQTSGDK
jgi:hypothetical protein